MVKTPNSWNHKRSVALVLREKDIATVAELHAEGLTFREIGARLGMAVARAHARYREAIERYKERAAEAHDARAAAYRVKREFLYREAIAAWRRSQVEQERKRARKRQPGEGGKGGFTEEEIEVKKLLGDPRFLAEADKQLNALARLDAFDAPQKHEITGKDGQPVNLFQLLLQAQREPAVEIGEDGEEHVIEASSVPLLPAPDGGDGNGEGFEDL